MTPLQHLDEAVAEPAQFIAVDAPIIGRLQALCETFHHQGHHRAFERRACRGHLLEHVTAVHALVEHALDPAHLSLDTAKPRLKLLEYFVGNGETIGG